MTINTTTSYKLSYLKNIYCRYLYLRNIGIDNKATILFVFSNLIRSTESSIKKW